MKLGVPFLQFPLQFDAEALAAEVQAIDESAWRPVPRATPATMRCCWWRRDGDPTSDATSGPMSATEHLRRCPYLMQVLEAIGGTWGRSRLMRLSEGRAEVTSHVDINYYWRERARVPRANVTQPTVRFVCGEAEVNMRAGECWIFDTWAEHNVINDHYLSRIHLVADTVGGAGFWEHVRNARAHGATSDNWQPRAIAPIPGFIPDLDYEAENFPTVMTPWEIRAHYAFLMGEAAPHPAVPLVHQSLLQFTRLWQALWSRYGERAEGWPRYRAAIEVVQRELVQGGAEGIELRNGVRLLEALQAWVFEPALAAHRRTVDSDIRQRAAQATAVLPATGPAAAARGATAGDRDPVFAQPVFIVCPPRSGSTLLFETLAQSPDLYTIGDESHQLIEAVPTLAPAARGFASNRLEAADATPAVVTQLRESFFAALRDRAERRPTAPMQVRMLEKTPKNALRVPFLARVFPEARFIYLHRDPASRAREHDRSVAIGPVPHLPEPAGLDGPALVAVAGARMARPRGAIAAADRRCPVERHDADPARRPRAPAGRFLDRGQLRRTGQRPQCGDPPALRRERAPLGPGPAADPAAVELYGVDS